MPENTNRTREILTDDRGRWLPGTASPNPGGRPKLTEVQKYLRKASGEVTEDLFNILIDIACYSQEERKDRWERVKPSEKIRAIELLLSYAHGKPTQHIEAEIETKSLNVQVRVPDDIDLSKI